MDCHLNLEFLCRVCAANTKGKNSVAECVYILKTPGLRDKLDRFLYLKVFENDALPKVLCKSCFRQVEATASLSKIAKDTQQVFRDFLLSSLPKGNANNGGPKSQEQNSYRDVVEKPQPKGLTITPAPPAVQRQSPPMTQRQSTPAPITAAAPVVANTTTTTTSANSGRNSSLGVMATPPTPRKDEVIVNVSVSDPLTRENQQKVISHSQRRHSIMLEAAEAAALTSSLGYIPKTIAQQSHKSLGTSANNRKSSSPAQILKFCPIAPKPLGQQQVATNASQQPTQVTTFSSGGYVIGPAKCTSNGAESNSKTSDSNETSNKKATLLPPTSMTLSSDNTILQQKRKNLVKALNNIKVNSTGQVSLLKSSQPKQQQQTTQQLPSPLLQSSNPQPAPGPVPPLIKLVNQVPQELPEKIIIAAPKNKPSKHSDKATEIVNAAQCLLNNSINAAAQEKPSLAKVSSFPEDIPLGRVIRDGDLLKLILKALKWPVNKHTMEFQLQRLKNSRFIDIMSDNNLLQDTDLTQLLGPYLAPVLMAVQALQQQQLQQPQQPPVKPSALAGSTSSVPASKSLLISNVKPTPSPPAKLDVLDATAEEINKAIPYKLPPETSVQLVPALPEDNDAQTALKKPSSAEPPAKRPRKSHIQRHRNSIVISDEEEAAEEDNTPLSLEASKQRVQKFINSLPLELQNPALLAQLAILSGGSLDLSNEMVLALLQQKQQKKTQPPKPVRGQKRRSSSVSCNIASLPPSEFDALINIDDDMLVTEAVSTTSSNATPTLTKVAPQKQDNFVIPLPVQNSAPLITRPIIKRRKTVIFSAKTTDKDSAINTLTKSISLPVENKTNAAKLPTAQATAMSAASANPQPSSTETSPIKGVMPASPGRKQQHKSALGQQLLEAICLQEKNEKSAGAAAASQSSQQTEAPTSSTNPPSTAMGKKSVHQIRSALKKSLKQAQDQQQQIRKKDMSADVSSTTVIQDADSTTKPTVKEIIIEGKSSTKQGSSSSLVDIEDQIDKTALVKNQPDVAKTLNGSEEDAMNLPLATFRKSMPARIIERRSTVQTVGAASRSGRGRATGRQEGKEKEKEEEQQQAKAIDSNSKSDAPVSSSGVSSATETKDDIGITPRRRYRKRGMEADQPSANETDKEKTKEKESPKTGSKDKEADNDKDKDKEAKRNSEQKTLKAGDKSKEDNEEKPSISSRSTRASKTLSKYYKGPDKPTTVERRSMPSRTTRNRKYC